jgi:RNA:NAD 2'-phosphotransferase (TPT1/KptA family)
VIEPGHKTLAGITRRVRFHDLRHTCASHLVMGTWGRVWRIEEICALVGHSGIGVTQRYAHLSPDHLHKAAAETVLAAPPRRSREGHEPQKQGLEMDENSFVFASERATGIEPATFSLGTQ